MLQFNSHPDTSQSTSVMSSFFHPAFSLPLAIFLSLLALLPLTGLAEEPPWINATRYDDGEYGPYPFQTFKTGNFVAPRPLLKIQSDRCATDLLTFIAPRGYVDPARSAQATILTHDGYLVWTSDWNGMQIYNFQTQTYKGEPVLTFWAGNDAVGGHGAGEYFIVSYPMWISAGILRLGLFSTSDEDKR